VHVFGAAAGAGFAIATKRQASRYFLLSSLPPQVRGLQAEYQRVTDTNAGKAAPAGSEEEVLRREVEVLRKQASAAEVG
jgi:hypothetical protein